MQLNAITAAHPDYRHDLGNDLILRWSTPTDTEAIAHLCGQVFKEKEDDPPNQFLMNWVRQVMSGHHILMGQNDFGVVEDLHKQENPIVACTCLLRHTWDYEGIAFPVGRPEIVATDSDYRNRGLIRALFGMIHARSEAEGHLVQAITGIPYFYRQFGYEYAMDLDGKRITFIQTIPKARDDEPPYTLRGATEEDIPLILDYYRHHRRDSILWMKLTEEILRFRFTEWQKAAVPDKLPQHMMLIDAAGVPQAFVLCGEKRSWRGLDVFKLYFAPQVDIQALTPPLLRALTLYGEQTAASAEIDPLGEIHFHLGRSHPIYDALGGYLAPAFDPPYAWYLRVPDLAAFLTHIAPVLEKRLASSWMANYSGTVKIDFYRTGLVLQFEQGRLTRVEPWHKPVYGVDPLAGFPPLIFLQLLFGYRSLEDLRATFPDVWAKKEAKSLLEILFPQRDSSIALL
ncbi:GNAT family N-acetyltransferase [Tengunoibacter tsumagoiensis]|uniref:N-acetyltransferase domain-containing protein n=1 Tax=Tengunoibacter tsumagoiensis TaxID=2014871 RepID=A0A402A712_9CHLR|nr:GNAT family N-acetyltransferase [Tengunoibacter tsumagoiensis]GCE14930.1 hypothetical protein KTT_47890 [Tengunoibacter tsumagoiensis]